MLIDLEHFLFSPCSIVLNGLDMRLELKVNTCVDVEIFKDYY